MTFLNPVFSERNCKMPDELTLTRIGYLRPFIRQSGDSIRPKWEMGNRKLLDYLLVCVNSGHGVFTLEEERFELEPGDLFWVPPDTPHSMRGDSERMHCIYLHFDLLYDPARSHWDAVIPGGTLDLSAYGHLMHPPLYDAEINLWRGRIPAKSLHGRIWELMRRMCRLHRRSPTHPLELSGMMLELLELIGRAFSAAPAGSPWREEPVAAAAYLERHHAEPSLSVAEAARRCGISGSHFRRLFKLRFGVTPLEYLRNFRNRRARELLIYTGLGIGEVAAAAGFHDIYDFSRTFKQLNGVSPLRFRQSARGLARPETAETDV